MLIGLDLHRIEELATYFDSFRKLGYDYISLPIFNKIPCEIHPRKIEISKYLSWNGADLILKHSDWSSYINGRLTTWNYDVSIPIEDLALYSNIMRAELDYALHLSLRSVSFELKFKSNVSCLAQILTEYFTENRLKIQVIVILDLTPNDCDMTTRSADEAYEYYSDLINRWHSLNAMCDSIPNISAMVKLSKTQVIDDRLIRVLSGETIVGIIFSNNVFTLNTKNFPILSNSLKFAIQCFFKYQNLCLVVSTDLNDPSLSLYTQYFRHIEQKYFYLITNSQLIDYQDFPQTPLQPLSTNLESGIYQVFEEDPVKYDMYEKAIINCLEDRRSYVRQMRILIVGAGRGPLVTRCVKASSLANCPVEIFALEKNVNAIPTLLSLNRTEWKSVSIIQADIREWATDLKFDLIVSELLGSFSDNELSPECLDFAEKFLKSDGIMIPSSYTSYLAPISAPKLYSNICHSQEKTDSIDFLQIPYVAFIHTSNSLDWPKPCFQFNHPNTNPSSPHTNERVKTLVFETRMGGVLHGFSGYFSCVLYKDIILSINPTSYTVGMSSWFPMFFPLKCPVDIKPGVPIAITMWRRTSSSVWYEWCLESPYTSIIHNSGGKHFKMLLN